MRRYHPKPFNEVPVSFELDLKLKEASMLNSLELETWEIAEQAINEWLAKNEPETIPMPSYAGIQWKKLFLPNGTVLRTVFGGKNHHCRVEDDQLRYEGKATSPSGFANLVGGIRRNAWKVIWILFPRSQTWQLANDLRPARSRQQASRPAPLASGGQAARPASPESASAACCRCGQRVPVDAGYDKEQRPPAIGQRTVHPDPEPEEVAAQCPERRTEAQRAVAPDLQQLAANARAAGHAQPHAEGNRRVSEQAHPQRAGQQQQEQRHQTPDRARQHAPDPLEQENEFKGPNESKGPQVEQQAPPVRQAGERLDLGRFNEARGGVIDRRQRSACRRRQFSLEPLLL